MSHTVAHGRTQVVEVVEKTVELSQSELSRRHVMGKKSETHLAPSSRSKESKESERRTKRTKGVQSPPEHQRLQGIFAADNTLHGFAL